MHPSPDVLALLALGEQAGTPDEQAHVESCTQCRTEIADLARAVAAGRGVRSGDGVLVTPPDRVWDAIRTELGFASATDETPAQGATGGPRSLRSPRSPARPAGEQRRDPGHGGHRRRRAGRCPDGAAVAAAGSTAGVTDIADARPRSSRGRRGLALLVAAAVALVLGLGLGLGLDRILGPRQTTLWTAQLQALPQFPGSSGEAMVQEDGNGHRTLCHRAGLPRAGGRVA